jgi:GR25 family glycosyltransferase involved in LPS biosynthesis
MKCGSSDVLGPRMVINLARTPQRWDAFMAANSGGPACERFLAVDGGQLTKADLVGRGLIVPDLDYTAGAIGCALSHLALWQAAVEGEAALTVCEDDAILHPQFETLAAEVAAQVPGFDLISWGWNFNSVLAGTLFGGTPFAMGFDQTQMRRSIDAFKAETPSPRALKLTRAMGTPCYTVSPAGAQRLMARCLPLKPLSVRLPLLNRDAPNSGIDIPMNAAYPDLAAFVSFPPLALTPNEEEITTVG